MVNGDLKLIRPVSYNQCLMAIQRYCTNFPWSEQAAVRGVYSGKSDCQVLPKYLENRRETIANLDKNRPKPHERAELAQSRGQLKTRHP